MKAKFKSKCQYKDKNFGRIIFITICFIGIFTFFLLSKFNGNIKENLLNISESEIKRVTYSLITEKINNSVLNKNTLDDILIISKNKKDEILYVSFNLDKAYKVLDNVSNILTNSLKSLENGSIAIGYLDPKMSHKAGGLILNIPLGNSLNNNLFFNLGPKIPLKVNFIGSILTNLETKITNYGLNNALVEVFVYIEFSHNIVGPFGNREINFKYDAIIASMMIEGEVPSFYNGVIESSSNPLIKNLD